MSVVAASSSIAGSSSRGRAPSRSVSIDTGINSRANSAWSKPAPPPAPFSPSDADPKQQLQQQTTNKLEISTEAVQELYYKMDSLLAWLSQDSTPLASKGGFIDDDMNSPVFFGPRMELRKGGNKLNNESETEDEDDSTNFKKSSAGLRTNSAAAFSKNYDTSDDEVSQQIHQLVPRTVESTDLRLLQNARLEELGAPLAAEVQDLERALADLQERPETEMYVLVDGNTKIPIASSSKSDMNDRGQPQTKGEHQQQSGKSSENQKQRDLELSEIACSLSNAFKSTCFDIELDTYGLRHEPQDQFVMAELVSAKRCLYICPDTLTNNFVLAWWTYKDSDSASSAQLQRLTTGHGGAPLGRPKPSVAALLTLQCGKDLDRDWFKQPDRRAFDFESYQKAGALPLILARNVAAGGGSEIDDESLPTPYQPKARTAAAKSTTSADNTAATDADASQLSKVMVNA